jgi:translation initiation factor 3 subunit C
LGLTRFLSSSLHSIKVLCSLTTPQHSTPILTSPTPPLPSESEDEVRVVKSKKDSAWDSMKDGIARIKNARRNTDWPLIQDEFAAVNKMIEKSKMLIITNGFPLFYIKMVAELEDHVQLAVKNKVAVAALKPAVSRALKQMKLQIKKHNDNYREQIADFRENPEKYGEDEAEEESDSSSSDSDEDRYTEMKRLRRYCLSLCIRIRFRYV